MLTRGRTIPEGLLRRTQSSDATILTCKMPSASMLVGDAEDTAVRNACRER